MVETKTVYKGYFKVEVVTTPLRTEEVVRATDSVSVLFIDWYNQKVVLIRQSRASMITPDNPEGMIVESVAGRFDVDLGPKSLIVKEAKEEIGATIVEDDVVLLNDGMPMAVSAGMTDEKTYLAYVNIKTGMLEEDRVFGVPEENEQIERIWIDFRRFLDYRCECIRVFAYQQWLRAQLLKGDGHG